MFYHVNLSHLIEPLKKLYPNLLNDTIMSQVGAQQGDPCGPLAFSLCLQPILEGMATELNIWYLDDGTLCGDPKEVLSNFERLIIECEKIGLKINPSKCELFFSSEQDDSVISTKFLLESK